MCDSNKQDIIDYCHEKYDTKTFGHAYAVSLIVKNNEILKNIYDMKLYGDFKNIVNLALCHDLLEDTDATIDEIISYFNITNNTQRQALITVLELITKQPDEPYIDYIKRIKKSNNFVAWCIKLADINHHFRLSDTLTERLKNKYITALTILL